MDTMSEKNYRITITILSLGLIYFCLMFGNKTIDYKKQELTILELNKKVDSLQILSDSLNTELFPTEVELGRYQIAFQIFMERNPKAASQYGDIISEETE